MTETPEQSYLKGLKILLVEDERIIRELVVRMLKALGIQDVTEASSAEVAWSYLAGEQRRPINALITDLSLPGVSGSVMLKKLRELPSARAKALPVIVLTGSADLATYNKVSGFGISSYLIKPVSVDVLRSALLKAVSAKVDALPATAKIPA